MSARAGNDARALLAASPRVRQAVPLIVAAAEAGQRVALVGGVVRDLLRGEEPHEVDVVVEGAGLAYAQRLGALTGAEVRLHHAFGTATVASRPPVDVATARREAYVEPGALPVVEPATLEEDLARRDLTVNAIAVIVAGPGAGTLLDPFDGRADLAALRLRLLRPDAFEEDATRLLRAARYAVRLGAEPDSTLVHAAVAATRGGFVALTSTSRMLDALRLVFTEAEPVAVLAWLMEWGVLTALEPGLAVAPERVRAAWRLLEDEARDADRVALGFGLVSGGLAPERRLEWLTAGGLDRATLKAALAAAEGPALEAVIAGQPDADVDAACARVPVEGVIAAGGAEAVRYLGRLRHIALDVDGSDVMQVAGVEGPAVGRLLVELRRACIDGSVAGDRSAQLAWLGAR